jgi:NAD(P)-dependent dehydrogenase (short-subunit alcohol dehydrogenase family)
MIFPSPTKAFHRTTYPAISPKRPELVAKGKTIVITGGGTGIGAETALYFAKAGAACVAILGRRPDPLYKTKASIETHYPETTVLALPTDVTKLDQVERALDEIARVGPLDVLISNAGVSGSSSK